MTLVEFGIRLYGRLEHVGKSLYKRRWLTGNTRTTQRVPNAIDVWNTLGSCCTNVAGSLGMLRNRYNHIPYSTLPGCVAQSIARLIEESEVPGSIPGPA